MDIIHLSDERARAVATVVPAETLKLLRVQGVPVLLVFHSIEHIFTLDMEPCHGGRALRIGTVDRGMYSMALEKGTGHFGYVGPYPGPGRWVFCNSSLACFLSCFAASERLWLLEKAGQIDPEKSGEWLECEFRGIDPVVFEDPNNPWAFLVEELTNGAI